MSELYLDTVRGSRAEGTLFFWFFFSPLLLCSANDYLVLTDISYLMQGATKGVRDSRLRYVQVYYYLYLYSTYFSLRTAARSSTTTTSSTVTIATDDDDHKRGSRPDTSRALVFKLFFLQHASTPLPHLPPPQQNVNTRLPSSRTTCPHVQQILMKA